MEIVIILLSIILGVCIFVIFNLLKKLEKYEDFIEMQERNNETLLETLRRVDSRQMFEKDDEVGSLFTQIRDIIIQFKQFN